MRKRIFTVALLIAALSMTALAQRGGGRGFGGGGRGGGQGNVNYDPGNQRIKYDGRWAFVRLRYQTGFGGRGGPQWAHDWPWGEQHFMQILDGVTNLDAHKEESNILTLDDPELFKYPIAYMAEPGYWTVNDKEAEGFRNYLLKGGFAIFDDFHMQDWPYFEQAMLKVLPDAKFIDLTPAHPIYHTFFEIDSFDIVQQYYDPGRPIFRAIFEDNDPKKRMLCMINYNTDISEFWEWSPSGFKPISESNEAYQIGVNWIIYGMTR